MMRDFEIEEFAHHVFDLLYPGVAEFHHLATMSTDDVIVLFEAVGFFVLRKVSAELVLFYQIEVDQQFQCIVHRGSADTVAAVFHVDVKRFGIEVVGALVNFFQNSEPFRGFAEAAFFQLCGKDFEHLLDDFLLVAWE